MKGTNMLMITSCKGGVGKSTVCANLAASLALRGERVLAVDLDFGMRCLDLIFGVEDHAVQDVRSAVKGAIPPGRACIKIPAIEGLYFLAAPYSGSCDLTAEELASFLESAAEELKLGYILLDTPGDMGEAASLAASLADSTLIISGASPTSIRGAGRTGELLFEKGLTKQKLIINRFDMKGAALTKKGIRPGVSEIIDMTRIPLIGVIPEDASLALLQEQGELCVPPQSAKKGAGTAFANIAARVTGETVPLFAGMKARSRKALL